MRVAANEHLPLALSSSTDPSLTPPGWDALSFVENLHNASLGDLDMVDFSDSATLQRFRADPSTCPNRSPQKKLYQELVEIFHAPGSQAEIHSTLTRRINRLFAPYEINYNLVNIDSCIHSLNLVSAPSRVKIVKTWLNGWATTYRIKGDFRRSCLLGCTGEPDSLAHYLMCPRIYACVQFVLPDTHEDPLIRIGLRSPSRESLLCTACMFHAYHALKAKINSVFDACIPDYTDYTHYWIFYAQSFSAEAGEHGLTSTLFDPDSF